MKSWYELIFFPAGMSAVNSRLSGEEGDSITAECLYSERYRYLTFTIHHITVVKYLTNK